MSIGSGSATRLGGAAGSAAGAGAVRRAPSARYEGEYIDFNPLNPITPRNPPRQETNQYVALRIAGNFVDFLMRDDVLEKLRNGDPTTLRDYNRLVELIQHIREETRIKRDGNPGILQIPTDDLRDRQRVDAYSVAFALIGDIQTHLETRPEEGNNKEILELAARLRDVLAEAPPTPKSLYDQLLSFGKFVTVSAVATGTFTKVLASDAVRAFFADPRLQYYANRSLVGGAILGLGCYALQAPFKASVTARDNLSRAEQALLTQTRAREVLARANRENREATAESTELNGIAQPFQANIERAEEVLATINRDLARVQREIEENTRDIGAATAGSQEKTALEQRSPALIRRLEMLTLRQPEATEELRRQRELGAPAIRNAAEACRDAEAAAARVREAETALTAATRTVEANDMQRLRKAMTLEARLLSKAVDLRWKLAGFATAAIALGAAYYTGHLQEAAGAGVQMVQTIAREKAEKAAFTGRLFLDTASIYAEEARSSIRLFLDTASVCAEEARSSIHNFASRNAPIAATVVATGAALAALKRFVLPSLERHVRAFIA